MRRGQAQPQRRSSARVAGPALRASQRGTPAFLAHPSTPKRRVIRKRRRKAKYGYKTPLHRVLKVRSRY
jgi:hypothetical protein